LREGSKPKPNPQVLALRDTPCGGEKLGGGGGAGTRRGIGRVSALQDQAAGEKTRPPPLSKKHWPAFRPAASGIGDFFFEPCPAGKPGSGPRGRGPPAP